MTHVSPSAEFRRLLRLHGPHVAIVCVRHGVLINIADPNAPQTGTGICLLNAQSNEIASTLGWTLPTITIGNILSENFHSVSDVSRALGDVVDIRVARYHRAASHARD